MPCRPWQPHSLAQRPGLAGRTGLRLRSGSHGRAAGAAALKVSGAGGGGFMMFFADPTKRMAVMRALQAEGAQTLTCHFTQHGTEGWKIF